MKLYDKRCTKCNRLLSYGGRHIGNSFRIDFFECWHCKKEYVLETNINGKSYFYEEE